MMSASLVRSFYRGEDPRIERSAAHIRERYLVPFFAELGWPDGLPSYPVLVLDEGTQARPGAVWALLRDAFSAGFSVAVVTDFARLEIYDLTDPLLLGGTPVSPEQFTATEFPTRWSDLEDRLSPSGWPAREIQSVVCSVLADQISGWRLILGRSLCRGEFCLSDEDLNLSVQRTIDLLLLLRTQYERGYPAWPPSADDDAGSDLRRRLLASAAAFIDPSRITPPYWPGDDAVTTVMQRIADPGSPISLKSISSETLAVAFETVLRTLLVAEGSRMTERPNRLITAVDGVAEVPDRMLRTVAAIALQPLLSDRNRSEVPGLRIVDPCCGTGRLLIAACRHLHALPLNWGEVLSIVSGVEQDPCQAEVAVLVLVLTAGEDLRVDDPVVTPDIRRGNPLVGTDFYEDPLAVLLEGRRLRRLAPFDWSTLPPPDRGFDVVLTAIPATRTSLFAGEDTYLPGHYATFQTGGDRSICLVERMIPLVADGGAITILFPDRWLRGDRSDLFRAWLAGRRLSCIVEIPALRLTGTDHHLCLLQVGPGEPAPDVAAAVLDAPLPPDPGAVLAGRVHRVLAADLSPQGWALVDRRYPALIERLNQAGRPLDDLLLGGIVDGGAVSGQFPAGLQRRLVRRDRRIRQFCRPVVIVDRAYAPPVRTGYCVPQPVRPPAGRIVRLLQQAGVPVMEGGEDPRFGPGQKILCSVRTGVCTFDRTGTQVPGPGTVALVTADLFLLGLLNSSVGAALIGALHQGEDGDLRLCADLLLRVRVRVPDCYDPVEQGLHDQVVTLVGRLLGLCAVSAPPVLVGPLIERIDWCIRALYGISAEEGALLHGEGGLSSIYSNQSICRD